MVILELQETLNRVSLGLIINTFKPKLHCNVLHFSDILIIKTVTFVIFLRTRKLSSCVREQCITQADIRKETLLKHARLKLINVTNE